MIDEIMTVTKPKVKSNHLPIRNQELTLRIHTDESVFSTLDTQWEELARLSNQMICMSSGWAASWWKHFGRHKNRSLHIVTIYDNQRLVAIFPFFKGITKAGSLSFQKRIQLIGCGVNPNEQLGFTDDYGISDFLDVIVDPEYSTRIANLFVKLLDSQEFAGYKIIFHQVRDDSYIKQTLYPLLENAKRKVRAKHTDTCPYIKLEQNGNLQEFIKKSKSNARRRFRQTLRARGAGNEYLIEEPAGMTDVEQMIDILIEMHQKRWNKIGYPGAFQDERFRAFFKEISITAYREERLWIKQAVDESGICAVRMLLKYNGRYYDYMSGYNDDSPSAKHRPGIGLLLELIENSFEQHIERIELLRGDEGYKQDFTKLSVNNWKIIIPETRQMRTGWGLPASIIQIGSNVHKYIYREKKLMEVQYKKAGMAFMVTAYFRFRCNTLKNKMHQLSGTG